MHTLYITPSSTGVDVPPATANVTHSSATADTGVDVSAVTPTNDWTLYLKVWSPSLATTSWRARIAFEDSNDNFMSDIQVGPVRCIVPMNNVPEGRTYSIRWRDFDDLRIGVSSCKLRTHLTRITGGNITYSAWLTY